MALPQDATVDCFLPHLTQQDVVLFLPLLPQLLLQLLHASCSCIVAPPGAAIQTSIILSR